MAMKVQWVAHLPVVSNRGTLFVHWAEHRTVSIERLEMFKMMSMVELRGKCMVVLEFQPDDISP